MAKTENYTPEMTTAIVDAYVAVRDQDDETRADKVAELAVRFDKSIRSIRGKLTREKVYVSKQAKSAVTGGKPAKKEELAAQLVDVSGLNLVSAEKLNKTDLVALIQFAKEFQELREDFADLELTAMVEDDLAAMIGDETGDMETGDMETGE